MRLLELYNGGLRITEDLDDHEIPPYAILSHTWGHRRNEVTFKDINDGTGHTKTGYAKVKFCGERAAQDGLKYFWVDSCCIDKSSSAELQEAIASMFRWYERARKCYVYLADVSVTETHERWSWEQAFRGSRWFTRGWTLQEMLAPSHVEFFSEECTKLGDKEGLRDLLNSITGIHVDALQGCPLSEFNIEERLAWAKWRHTTRGEDEAYCLFGICGVSMPIIYGEGRENALHRLDEEITKRYRGNNPITSDVKPTSAESRGWYDSITNPKAFNMRQLGETTPEIYRDDHEAGIENPIVQRQGERLSKKAIDRSSDAVTRPALQGSRSLKARTKDELALPQTTTEGRWELLHTLTGHSKSFKGIAFRADSTLVSGSSDRTIKTWDVASGVIIHTIMGFNEQITAVVCMGGRVVVGSLEGPIQLWGSQGRLISTFEGGFSALYSLAISPCGVLACARSDATVEVWDVGIPQNPRWIWSTAQNMTVLAIDISIDGNVAIGGSKESVLLWDGNPSDVPRNFRNHPSGSISALSFSPDGTVLAASGRNVTMIWDLKSSKIVRRLTDRPVSIGAIAFSPNGELLATGGSDGNLALWDWKSGTLVQLLEDGKTDVREVTFSPDGSTIASGSSDASVRLWRNIG